MNRNDGLAAFEGKRYLSLESFRRNGTGVRTPVWFAAALDGEPRLFVYSVLDSGKVRIAPCGAGGKVTGDWIEAQASVAGPEEFQIGMTLLNRKYWPWKQVLGVFARLGSGGTRVVIAIRPE